MKRKSLSKEKSIKSTEAKKPPVQNSQAKRPAPGKKGQHKKANKKENGIKPFPVVGIGASAGGLEAFSKFLENLAPDLGMAYVYVQHLSPNHESFLTDILERKTRMSVFKAKDKMQIESNNVYVIPENKAITITDGVLELTERPKEKNFHSIDHFLLSLASAYRENAIGILLSGTATDGTVGLKAIKAEGGISFAQDDSAKYSDMPQHAVEMGYVDFVMPPDKIARELAMLITQPYGPIISPNELMRENKHELHKIHMIMHARRDIDFSHYKQTTIQRRIIRRMLLNHMSNMNDYANMLNENKAEVDALYQDLLITVTNFFRDESIYTALTNKVLPSIISNHKSKNPLRIWVPGCATGEEAISIAIVIMEYLGEKTLTTELQIFATDLNEKSIEKARTGIFTKSALQNVSPERLKKFFVKIDGHYQVIKSVRDCCIFATHNLLKDPPFSRLDVISCQNVLIYLEAQPQNKLMHIFHYALKSTGYLLLGKSETIGIATDIFQPLSKDMKIYTKKDVERPVHFDLIYNNRFAGGYRHEEVKPEIKSKEIDLEKETEKLLLKKYVPASVLVNKDMEIVRFRGATSRYLEPATGKASLHLMKMVKEELSYELKNLLQQAKKQEQPVKKDKLFFGGNGAKKEISIEVARVKGNGKEIYYLVIFQENGNHVPPESTKKNAKANVKDWRDKQIATLELQLKEAQDNMRLMSEEFESTKEELQSANEEILSSNEELQSINEEIETSKEELQSTNEELTTVNEELQNRNSELREAIEYADIVFETQHEAMVVLSSELKVKKANKGFYKMFEAIAEETEGHYLFELSDHQWNLPELRNQLRLLQTKNISFVNFEVEYDFPRIGFKSILLSAQRISNQGKMMILLGMHDITSRKSVEQKLKENEERFRLLIQNTFDIISLLDRDGTILYESPAIEAVLGYSMEERIGKNIINDALIHPDDKMIKENMLKDSIENPTENIKGEFRLLHRNGSYRTIDAICRNMLHDKRINGIIATYRDITDRKKLEQQKDEFIAIASHELKTPVTSIKAYAQILEDSFIKSKNPKSADLLTKMNSQVDRLTTLIIDLLDFTRIEGGKLKFREENYSLNELVKEITTEMQRTTRQHVIITKLDKDVKPWGDRFRTGQVLTNLLSNAIKYSPNSKKIVVSTKKRANEITVCVQDFGVGIEPGLTEKVFERFFRVTEPVLNTFPGLGLGLYIAAEIVKRHGGRIWAKSERNKGSVFCFSIPTKKNKK